MCWKVAVVMSELHFHPTKTSSISICCFGEKSRRVTPKLLQTVPTKDFPKFLAGAIIPKKFEGKHADPSAERPSEPGSSSGGIRRLVEKLSAGRPFEPSSSSAGPEHQSRCKTQMIAPGCHQDHFRKIHRCLTPKGKSKLETSDKRRTRCSEEPVTSRQRKVWCTNFTQNWCTPTSVARSAAQDNEKFIPLSWRQQH